MTTHAEVGQTSRSASTSAPRCRQAAGEIGDRRCAIAAPSAAPSPTPTRQRTTPRPRWPSESSWPVKSQAGERTVAADDWFVDLLTTAIEPGEIVTEVRVPSWPNSAYVKYENPASEYAIVGVAAALKLSGDTVEDVRVGVTGAAARAYRASPVETALKGKTLSASAIKDAAAGAAEGQETMGDVHASEEYRAHLARLLTERALLAAWQKELRGAGSRAAPGRRFSCSCRSTWSPLATDQPSAHNGHGRRNPAPPPSLRDNPPRPAPTIGRQWTEQPSRTSTPTPTSSGTDSPKPWNRYPTNNSRRQSPDRAGPASIAPTFTSSAPTTAG